MELTTELRSQLVQAVHDFIGEPAGPQTIRLLIGSAAMAEAPSGLNGYRYASWLVGYALNRRSSKVFVLMLETCDPAGALPELQALAGQLKSDERTWSSAADGLWVPDSWPFINRRPLRDALTTMAGGSGPVALAIEGPSGHGKRTMAEYVRFLASDTGAFQTVLVDLRREPDHGVLFAMVTDLAIALGFVADLNTTHEEPERQATILARDVALASAAAPSPTWFVANVMGRAADLEDGVLAFVDELLGLVQATPPIGEKLRVLLLCDQLSVLELANPPPTDARHTLGQVSEVEIRQWFEAAVPGKPAMLYRLTTQSVIDNVDNVGPPIAKRLRYLSQQCRVAHRQLAAAGDV
jgi:hypothetical protein